MEVPDEGKQNVLNGARSAPVRCKTRARAAGAGKLPEQRVARRAVPTRYGLAHSRAVFGAPGGLPARPVLGGERRSRGEVAMATEEEERILQEAEERLRRKREVVAGLRRAGRLGDVLNEVVEGAAPKGKTDPVVVNPKRPPDAEKA